MLANVSTPQTPLAYSVTEAAQALRVCPDTVRRQIRAGKLRTVRLGARVVIPATELARLLEDPVDVPPLAG